jgi:restriction system protein
MKLTLTFWFGALVTFSAFCFAVPLLPYWWAGKPLAFQQLGQALACGAGGFVGIVLMFAEYGAYRKKKRWFERHAKQDALKAMPWDEFERLVGSTFRQWGFKVEDQGGARADGGIDLIVWKKGKKYLVQCKRYKGSVGVPIVREIFGVMISEKFDGAYIMTSGHFTKESWAFAKGKPMKLISGEALAKILEETASGKRFKG